MHSVRLGIARRLAAMRLHRWNHGQDLPDGWLRKRRTRIAEILIPLGNLYLFVQGAMSEVLSCENWIAWELAIAAQFGRNTRTTKDRTGLEFEAIPGISLEQLLRSHRPLNEKLRGICLSAAALRDLHRVTISAIDATNWPLSHGDATCRNVVVDLATETASWIDFDMRHRPQFSWATRRADDLRALLWSSAACLDVARYSDCVCAAFEGYSDVTVVRDVQAIAGNLTLPTVFQLGQSALLAEDFFCLNEIIRQYEFVSQEGRPEKEVVSRNG